MFSRRRKVGLDSSAEGGACFVASIDRDLTVETGNAFGEIEVGPVVEAIVVGTV